LQIYSVYHNAVTEPVEVPTLLCKQSPFDKLRERVYLCKMHSVYHNAVTEPVGVPYFFANMFPSTSSGSGFILAKKSVILNFVQDLSKIKP